MGCGGSKTTRTKNSISPAPQPAQETQQKTPASQEKPEQPASEGPVTQRQVQLARETWAYVQQDLRGHGIVFYTRLFTVYPETQQLFSFRDVEGIDNLKQDERFLRQAKKVMEMVGAAVDGLDDIPTLVLVLKELGARHVKWNIREEHYGPVGEALVYTLKQGLGDKFTEEVKEAWLAVYGVVGDTMKAGAREAMQAQNEQ